MKQEMSPGIFIIRPDELEKDFLTSKDFKVIKEKLNFLENKVTPEQLYKYGMGLLVFDKMNSTHESLDEGVAPERLKGWFGLEEDVLKEHVQREQEEILHFLQGVEMGLDLTMEEKTKARNAFGIDNEDEPNTKSNYYDNTLNKYLGTKNAIHSSKKVGFEEKK